MTDQVNEALDYTPGELDRTAPERIWLQIDIGAGKDYRDEPFPTDIDGVTWHNESIGGLEVQYVRADLAAHLSRGVVDEIDPNSRNFIKGMEVGRAELAIVRRAIDSRQCDECGARSPEEAQTMCRPDGDSCPGTEWPLADLWGLQAAKPAVPSGPEGFVLAPHYRGYAKLGSGGYFLYHSGKGELAELVIVPATDADREGRTVGDLSYDGPDEIPAERIAVRLRFDNVAGPDALEQQLRLLRDEHFAATPKDQPAQGVG